MCDKNFAQIGNATINDYIPVQKFQSEKTGLTVVLADVEGPIVTGHFVLSTEAHDDDGLPHTLEHLIFLGSEKYPYKGVLDLLANRCLASGTNAWTDTDHTCYTMTTAGSDGFLKLMPIYLDHILYPTLTDSGFLTEVHHITGEGEDGGVVYCEMQGTENTGESRAHLQLLRAAYPDSGYCSETGGIMKNLRESTNNEKVRKYHATFYRPENLTVIITGRVSKEDVFKALASVEEKILEKGRNDPFTRPWQSKVEPIKKSEDMKVLYPSDEEDCGLVYVGYRGPDCIKDYITITGCSLLLRYLTDTSVSPLQREFVEVEDPLASKVTNSVIENRESLLYFMFENVPVKKINEIYGKLKLILKKFAIGEEKIDMIRMRSIIEKEVLESFSNLENNPHDTAAFLIIGDVIYGDTSEDFQSRLNIKKQLEHFLQVDEKYWANLIDKYFVQSNYVCIRSVPSIGEQENMSKEELQRIEQQRANLGPEGLEEKARELKNAMAKNEEQPPVEMLTQVPVPSISNMVYHFLKIYKSTETENHSNIAKKAIRFEEFPVYTEVYDIHTNFVYLMVTLNTGNLETRLRPYLLLFLELLLESAVNRDNKIIPYEEVVSSLERDTIVSSTRLGLESNSSFICGPFSSTALLLLQVEPKKYEIGVNWIKDLLHNSIFMADRVKVVVSKMANSISQVKRKGNLVVRDLLKAMYYPEDSNIRLCSMLKQQKFLNALLESLDDGTKSQSILNDLNEIRGSLLQPQNVSIHISANISNMYKEKIELAKPWKTLFKSQTDSEIKANRLIVIPEWKIININGTEPNFQGTVVGLGAVESAFLFHAAPSINDFMDPDLPAVMLYLQYLTQLEGPLWRQIRGQGFAYGYNIVPRPHEGLLCFTLYRATNLVAAYRETKIIIENHLSQSNWDENLLDSARSSLVFEIIERERSIGNLVVHSLLCSFKDVPSNYNQDLVKKVNKVSIRDLNAVGEKYIAKLFSPQAKTAIVCHPDKVQEMATAFVNLGRNLKPVLCLDDSCMAV